MQKNLFAAVALSSLVYVLWFAFVEKKAPPRPAAEPHASAQAVPGGAPQASPSASLPAAAPAPAAARTPADPLKGAVTVRAGKASFTVSPEGGAIVSAVYEGPVAPVELVREPLPGLFASFPGAAFRAQPSAPGSAVFAGRVAAEISAVKKYTFDPENGIHRLEVTLRNDSRRAVLSPAWELRLGPGLGTVGSEQKENEKLTRAAYAFMEPKRKHPTVKQLEEDASAPAWVWAGLDNRYFLVAAIGEGLERSSLSFSEQKLGPEGKEKAPALAIPFAQAELAPGASRTWTIPFYAGPKDYALLGKLGNGLDRSVDFGFFAPLAKLADSTLASFHRLTGNYGWAIILLSILIQIVLFPLSWKSYKAMAVMKKIQPEMQAIQQRYKEDPRRMNQEVMELYKRHGTNPLGGCLPMLLQIPVFFALFTALRNAWSLHGAPFVFWIKDLSAKDPYYVLPLVMGGIMFLQQHLSPQTSDPAQASVMKWMPVIFTFMFLTFPSGLVLYWLVNSVFGFAQTMYMQRKMNV